MHKEAADGHSDFAERGESYLQARLKNFHHIFRQRFSHCSPQVLTDERQSTTQHDDFRVKEMNGVR